MHTAPRWLMVSSDLSNTKVTRDLCGQVCAAHCERVSKNVCSSTKAPPRQRSAAAHSRAPPTDMLSRVMHPAGCLLLLDQKHVPPLPSITFHFPLHPLHPPSPLPTTASYDRKSCNCRGTQAVATTPSPWRHSPQSACCWPAFAPYAECCTHLHVVMQRKSPSAASSRTTTHLSLCIFSGFTACQRPCGGCSPSSCCTRHT